jgi:hypothetical protein
VCCRSPRCLLPQLFSIIAGLLCIQEVMLVF